MVEIRGVSEDEDEEEEEPVSLAELFFEFLPTILVVVAVVVVMAIFCGVIYILVEG